MRSRPRRHSIAPGPWALSLPSAREPRDAPVVVEVTSDRDVDALLWAAAEAAFVGAPLRVVHPVPVGALSPRAATVLTGQTFVRPAGTFEEAGRRVLEWALKQANEIAPELAATGCLSPGRPLDVFAEASENARLVVVGRSWTPRAPWRPAGLSPWRRLTDLSATPVVVAGLARPGAPGQPTGSLLVVISPHDKESGLLDASFSAAQRRGVGVTIMLLSEPSLGSQPRLVKVTLSAESVSTRVNAGRVDPGRARACRAPDAAAIEHVIAGEARGAALLVVGVRRSDAHRSWVRRAQLVDRLVLRATVPVMLVPTCER
ncbi:hypothetical protein ACXR8F_16340 [Terrabacter sp. AAH1]|jgi:hypothetical protein